MIQSLRIVLVDRNPAALGPLACAAQQAGFCVEWLFADQEAGLRRYLQTERLDLVVSAYPPAGFDLQQTLQAARAFQPGLPFILLADSLTESVADFCLSHPITDYVLRGQPARLGRALARTLACEVRHAADGRHPAQTRSGDGDDSGRRPEYARPGLEPKTAAGDPRSRFMSLVSHEFRTPLAVIMTTAELLNRYGDRLPPARKQTYLDTICGQVRTLNDMLDDVSVFMRAEAGRLEFEPQPVDLGALCQEIVAEMQAGAGASHTIHCQVEDGCDELWLDPALARHALRNLLANAVKYSPPGSEVQVRLRRDGQDALLEVADSGLGIPEADQPHIFEPYFRGSNVQQIGGTGLGLRIIKAAADLHGGRVTVASQEGVGTTFSLRLPAGAAADRSGFSAPLPTAGCRPCNPPGTARPAHLRQTT